jgi:hypothetical protein
VFPGATAVALGVARSAVDEMVALATRKTTRSGLLLADEEHTQYAIAKADAALKASRLLLFSAVEALQDAAQRGDEVTIEQRADLRAAMTHAADVGREALVAMYTLASSSALYRADRGVSRRRPVACAWAATPVWGCSDAVACELSGVLDQHRQRLPIAFCRLGCRVGITATAQLDDLVVLGDRLAAGQRREPQMLEPPQQRGDLLEHLRDDVVTAGVDGDPMEFVVAVDGGSDVPCGQAGGESPVGLAHRLEVLAVHERNSGPHRERLGVSRPGSVCTRPAASNRLSASRIGVRLTPSHSSRSGSRRRSPGASVPSMMASRSDM